MKFPKQARLHFYRAGPAEVLISKELCLFRALRDQPHRSVDANVELDQVGITAVMVSCGRHDRLICLSADWDRMRRLRASPHLLWRPAIQDEHRPLGVVPNAEHVELALDAGTRARQECPSAPTLERAEEAFDLPVEAFGVAACPWTGTFTNSVDANFVVVRIRSPDPPMPTLSGYVPFECGTRYRSNRIALCTFDYEANGSWLFAMPVDAQPMAKRRAVGACRLHLRDGRTGACRWIGSDEATRS